MESKDPTDLASHNMPTVTTYTQDISICSQICRVAVHEHGLGPSCTHKHVDIECRMENYEPWYIRIQPKMTVPAMQYDDAVVGDSREILYFLAERHPGLGLYPSELRPAIDAFIDGFYSRFGLIGAFTFGHLVQDAPSPPGNDPALTDFIRRGKIDRTREQLRKSIAEAPDVAELAQKKLAQKSAFDMVAWAGRQDCAALCDKMGEVLAQMEKSLADQSLADQSLADQSPGCLLGESYTLADVVATIFCSRINFIKGPALFGPHTVQYFQRMQARPSYEEAHIVSSWAESLMAKQLAAAKEGADPLAIGVGWPDNS